MRTYLYHRRLHWSECDPGGIIFFPHYARWMVDGLNEMFLSLGVDPNEIKDGAIRGALPVLAVSMKFHSPPALHEDVMLQISVTKVGGKSLVFPSSLPSRKRAVDGGGRYQGLGDPLAKSLHVRRPDDEATCNPDIYRRVNALVREKCDIVINNSTGGGSDGDLLIERPDGLYDVNFEERLKGLDAGAEMATFDCFTLAALHGNRELLLSTTPSQCDRLAKRFIERGIKPEWEVFSPAHILQDVTRLVTVCDKPPYFVNIVLNADRGFQGAMPYTPEILQMMVKLIPKDSIFNVSAIGPAQLPATTHAILLGGHVRVGLEDNLFYSKGVMATNEMLVERQVRIIRELGFEPATPKEARQMMGLV